MGVNHVKHFFYAAEFYFDDLTLSELDSVLQACKIPSARSPVHDQDVYTDLDIERYKEKGNYDPDVHIPGAFKKSHVHVVFQMPYAKQPKSSLIFINENLPKSLQLSYIQAVGYPPIYNRYLCHLDDPAKAQYSTTQIKIFHDYKLDLSKPSVPKSQRNVLDELIRKIQYTDSPHLNITKLLQFYREDDDMLKFICKNSYLVGQLLREHNNPNLYN